MDESSRLAPPVDALFACCASPCSPLSTLPGAASAVIASSPGEARGAVLFCFKTSNWCSHLKVSMRTYRYTSVWNIYISIYVIVYGSVGSSLSRSVQVDVSNPGKPLCFFLVRDLFLHFFCLAPCIYVVLQPRMSDTRYSSRICLFFFLFPPIRYYLWYDCNGQFLRWPRVPKYRSQNKRLLSLRLVISISYSCTIAHFTFLLPFLVLYCSRTDSGRVFREGRVGRVDASPPGQQARLPICLLAGPHPIRTLRRAGAKAPDAPLQAEEERL